MSKDQTNTKTSRFGGDVNRTLNDAMMTSMAECFAIQKSIMNIPKFDGKNIPVRDFIQHIINGESSVPANCEPQYIN